MKIKHITAMLLTVCLLATTTITPAYAGDWTGDNSGTPYVR